MNKRKLSRLMRERVGALLSLEDCYFFRSDFEYVLRGVLFEYMPRGLYVCDFRLPLFDSHGLPHGVVPLTYSDRLSGRGGYIGKGEMSEEAIVDFVMSSREAQSAFAPHDKLTELPDFVHFLESRLGFSRFVHGRLVHVAALLLMGQESRAASLLDDLEASLNETSIEMKERARDLEFTSARRVRGLIKSVGGTQRLVAWNPAIFERDVEYCNLLRTCLQQGPAATRDLLDEVRQENLRKMGVVS